MELHTAIRNIVNLSGNDILKEKRVVNILSDFNAYEVLPSAKFVLKNIIEEGFMTRFLELKEWSLECDKLIDYNSVGPNIAEKMENDPNNRIVAEYMLNNYIMPATVKGEDKDYQGAVEIYERMIKTLAAMYHEMKENILDSNIDYGNLINISISKSF